MSARRSGLFILLAVLVATPCWSKVTVREHVMPTTEGQPFTPAACGDWVVACLNSNPNNMNSTIGVIAYDLRAKQVYTLYEGKASCPAITGPLTMWSGNVDNVHSLRGSKTPTTINSHLITYDLASGRYRAPKLATAYANNVTASGDYISYEMRCRIYLYNIRTGDRKRISDDRRVHRYPDVSGDLVVWLEYDSELKESRVRGYRISTGEQYYFSQDYESSNSRPKTDGDYVVWHSNKVGGQFYEVRTGKVRTIKFALYPDVSNGLAVFEKSATARTESHHASRRILYGVDLKASGEEFRISKNEGIRQSCIGDNRAVWVEGNTLHYADLTRK